MKTGFYIMIAIGGATGAVIRGWLGEQISSNHAFPTSTFIVNMIGCLLIGSLYHIHKHNDMDWLMPLLMIGFLGGLTTFSSFGLDLFKLVEIGNWSVLGTYVVLTNILGLGLIWLGIKITSLFVNS